LFSNSGVYGMQENTQFRNARAGRWARSICPDVQLRPNRACTLKRHFRGCLRQVIGYLDLLASRDHERFVWCSWKNIVQHARKWRQGGRTFKHSMVFRCLDQAKELGIIETSSRIRNGCVRTGFIVKNHDVLVRQPEGARACLLFTGVGMRLEPEVEWQQPSSGTQAVVSGTESGMVSHPERNNEWNGKPSRPSTNTRKIDGDDEFHRGVLPALSLSALSKEPCTNSPVEPTTPDFASLDTNYSASFSSDRDQLPGYGISDREDFDSTRAETIAQHFSFANLKPEEVCEVVSMGEFDSAYLKHYGSARLLAECCHHAAAELADVPFRGPQSCARVMGRAMELLRMNHGVNAPSGWVPVLKRLRKSNAPGTECALPEVATASIPQASDSSSIWDEIPRPSAEKVLTDPFSCLSCFPDQMREALRQNPLLEGLMIETARETGVPDCYATCLDYMNSVIRKLKRQDSPVPDALIAVRKHLQDTLADIELSREEAAPRKRTSVVATGVLHSA